MVPFPTAPNNCYATFCLYEFDYELWNRICHFCHFIALSIMSLRSVHLGAFEGGVILHCMDMPYFSIYSSADGHLLGCFHLWAIVSR